MLKEQLCTEDNRAFFHNGELLCEKLRKYPSYALWGAGNTGESVIDFLQKRIPLPKVVCDNNSALWGKKMKGIEIVSPDHVLKEKYPAMMISTYAASEVTKQLEQSGYQGELFYLILTKEKIIKEYSERSFYMDNIDALEQVYQMLADEESRLTLLNVLNFRLSGKVDYLSKINKTVDSKLMLNDLLQLTGQESFVDVGAFNGDTIQLFLRQTNSCYKKINAFEPENQNYRLLLTFAEENHLENFTAYQTGVWSENTELHFSDQYSESYKISEEGKNVLPVVALDNISSVQDCSFLKLSTNGFELQCLEGSENILRENKPKIATYVSGQRDLLFTIPQFIHQILPGHRLYLRHHSLGLQATACYAVP